MSSGAIDPMVFVAVLSAAAMHAGWNATLKMKGDPFFAMTRITTLGGVIAVPLLMLFGFPRLESWPWLMASIVLHLGYYIALTEAYRHADMSQVYPIRAEGRPFSRRRERFCSCTSRSPCRASLESCLWPAVLC